MRSTARWRSRTPTAEGPAPLEVADRLLHAADGDRRRHGPANRLRLVSEAAELTQSRSSRSFTTRDFFARFEDLLATRSYLQRHLFLPALGSTLPATSDAGGRCYQPSLEYLRGYFSSARPPGDRRRSAVNVGHPVSSSPMFPVAHILLRPCARRINSLDGRRGSRTLRAVSTPATGRLDESSNPSCTRTDAWSQ